MIRKLTLLAALLLALPALAWDDSPTYIVTPTVTSPWNAHLTAGTLYSNPDFGTLTKRLSIPGGAEAHPEYSNLQAWSKNQDRLLLYVNSSYTVFNYPEMTVLRGPSTSPAFPSGATAVRWDPSDNDTLFYFKDAAGGGSTDMNLYKLTVSTGSSSTVLSLSSLSDLSGYDRNCTNEALQEMSTSGTAAGKWISVVVLNTSTNKLRTLAYDVKGGVASKYVETDSIGDSCASSYNWTMVSPNGDYLLTAWNGKGWGATPATQGVEAYPITAGPGAATKAGQVTGMLGHADIIKDSSGQWLVMLNGGDSGDVCGYAPSIDKHRIPDGLYAGSTPPANCSSSFVTSLLDPTYYALGGHVSCRASNRYALSPSEAYCVFSQFGSPSDISGHDGVPAYTHPFENEVTRIYMDSTTSTPHVNRMGNHRSWTENTCAGGSYSGRVCVSSATCYGGSNSGNACSTDTDCPGGWCPSCPSSTCNIRDGYWDQPHATLSRDGEYILYGSNWGTSSGSGGGEVIYPYIFTNLDDLPANTWLKLNTIDRKISDAQTVRSQVATANSFSGSMYDEQSRTWLNFGGGHFSYVASGVQRFDFDRIGWRQDYAPEAPAGGSSGCECLSTRNGTTPPIEPPRNMSGCLPAYGCTDVSHGRTALGRPWAYHSYAAERCDSSGHCMMFGTRGDVWRYSPASKAWAQMDPSSGDLEGCWFDANAGASFTYMNISTPRWLLVTPAHTREYTYTGSIYAPFTDKSHTNAPASGHTTAYVPISGGRVYAYGSSYGTDLRFHVYDPASGGGTWSLITPSTTPPSGNAPGMDYDSSNGELVVIGAVTTSGPALYHYNPSTGVNGNIAANGTPPTAPDASHEDNMIYGKWRYIKHLNVFAFLTSANYARGDDTVCDSFTTGPTATWVYRYAGGGVVECGNGTIETGEACDDGNTVIETECPYQVSGPNTCTACNDTCSSVLNLTGHYCGDSTIQGGNGEVCDTAQLNNSTCQSLGYMSGTLTCSASCQFNVSACSNIGRHGGVLGSGEIR